MKKLISMCLCAACAVAMTSCSDDDDPVIKNPDVPTISTGAFILNQGSWGKIDGSLNLLDYAKESLTMNVFKNVNGRSLGDTPQCGLVYGSKIYLGVYESKTIEIIDRISYKSIKQISLQDRPEGKQPRSMVAKGGKIYISMYDGYLCRLDTASMTIDASVKVGPNPEIIAIHGNNIYVPNSDGMNYPDYGETASVVSIEPFQEVKKIDVPLNPKQFLSNGKDLFILCLGNYGDIPQAVYSVSSDGKCEEISKASLAAIKGNNLYLIDFPWGAAEMNSYVYDISSKKLTDVSYENFEGSPSGLGVDPLTGNIVMTAQYIENGYPVSDRPGMVYLYDANRKLKKRFEGGIGAGCIFFNEE